MKKEKENSLGNITWSEMGNETFKLQRYNIYGRVFTSGFSGRLASDKRKFRENSSFPNSLKVKRVGKFQ